MNRLFGARRQVAKALLLAGVGAFGLWTLRAQVVPGQLPPGPPPQPGQLGPAPVPAPPQPSAEQETPGNPNPHPVSPDEEKPLFVTGVKSVLVPTTVLDPDGHGYVNGLNVGDFTVYDNGKAQKISAELTGQPLSVVLVVQANSEVEPLLPVIHKSGVLLHSLVTGMNGDVAVLAFDHRMQLMQDFTTDPDKIDDAVRKIDSGSSTAAISDAVMHADDMLRAHDHQNARRRVIILMSRNMDKGSQLKAREVARNMQFDNITVYCVDISRIKTALMKGADYPRPANGGVPPEATGSITGIPHNDTTVAQEQDGNWLNAVPPMFHDIEDLFKRSATESFVYFTGGNEYHFSNQRGLESAITDIGANLNTQYLLAYVPNDQSEPGFHTIRVVVDRPGLQVRTRPGYWLAGGQQ